MKKKIVIGTGLILMISAKWLPFSLGAFGLGAGLIILGLIAIVGQFGSADLSGGRYEIDKTGRID